METCASRKGGHRDDINSYLPQHDIYCVDIAKDIASFLLDGWYKVPDPLIAVNLNGECAGRRISKIPAFQAKGVDHVVVSA